MFRSNTTHENIEENLKKIISEGIKQKMVTKNNEYNGAKNIEEQGLIYETREDKKTIKWALPDCISKAAFKEEYGLFID